MKRHSPPWALCLTTLLVTLCLVGGCDDTVTVPVGSAGESCTSRSDCEEGLRCVDLVCKAEAEAETSDAAVEEPLATRGVEGESCTRRADCGAGLACIAEVCQSEAALPEGMQPPARGQRGESCVARNDCEPGLGCINGRCSENDFELSSSPKECFRVECATTSDCCEDFEIPSSRESLCAQLENDCALGSSFSCSDFNQLCTCTLTCEEETCISGISCGDDLDCFGGTVCDEGRCVECARTADCTGDATCSDGVCIEACERDEQCPRFHACDSGECVDVGCRAETNDCFFATGDPLAECVEGECRVPCESDSECGGAFSLCDEGVCKFVGCTDDAECRVFLGLDNQFGRATAVCR